MNDKILKLDSNEIDVIDFRFYEEINGKIIENIYGINVSKVKEIIEEKELTKLPQNIEYISGILDLRGVIVPVLDLAKFLKLKEAKLNKKKNIIIVNINNILIGIIVHETKRIRRFNWNDIHPFETAIEKNNYITGVIKLKEENKILLLLDLETIISEIGLVKNDLNIEKINKKFSGKVLLVDDSPTARKIEKAALEKLGFEVVEAVNGEEGLKKLEDLYSIYGNNLKNELKLILSDIEMPKMDGYHMASKIHEDPRFNKIPLLFSTSIVDAFGIEKSEKVGAKGYLIKFEPEKFYNEISKVIEKNLL